MSLTISHEGQHWKVTGCTYQHKELIKKVGGNWNPAEKAWTIPIANHIDELLDVNKAHDRMLAAIERSKLERQKWLEYIKCCSNCYVISQGKSLLTSCREHGFRKNGNVYTGD